jgi:hypothetical protein
MLLRVGVIMALFIMVATSASSYGQTTQTQTVNNIHVYFQIQIHNSQGQLVAYLEPTAVKFGTVADVNHYLDSMPKNIITRDGQKFNLVQIEETGNFTKNDVISEYTLNGANGEWILTVVNDGYQVLPGDSYDVWTTILAPVG